MALQTLPAEYLLRKHNLELVLMKKIEPENHFLNILPIAQNDIGEFPTVLEDPSAADDIKDGILSEPLDTAEASELTEVEISPLNAVLGETSVVGYSFKYTEKFLNRSDKDARLNLAVSKIGAGMAMKLNKLFLQGMVGGAKVALPSDLSNWATAPDPRADAIKLRHKFHPGTEPFKLTDAFIPGDKFQILEEYYMSMDWPFDSDAIDVDKTIFHNVDNSFEDLTQNFLGIDKNIPAGIIQKYVNPKYSTIAQAQLADPQASMNLPPALINILQFEPTRQHESYGFDIWAEIGYANQEPKGAMTGTLPA